MGKELWTTTDFYDDVIFAGRHFRKEDLDASMKYSASLGAVRHEWVLDTIWTLYDADGPVGYDLLAEACEAAHRHGMRFDVVFKPFEGGLGHSALLLPHDLPRPDGMPLLDETSGLVHAVRPFVAAHPEMRMARHPDDTDPGGRIAAIRLVKNDNAPAPFGRADLSILTSDRNGGFQPYDGPMNLTEGTEWRRLYPYRDRPSRVVTLEGLALPGDTRYVMIRCNTGDGTGDFTNAVEQLVELVNERGEVLPSTPSRHRVNVEQMFERATQIDRLELTRYARCPEVQALVRDRARFMKHCRDMHAFNAGWEDIALNRVGEMVLARGTPHYITGVLNPVYPEVRDHWMEHVRFCIDRNVDGVNFRVADHNRPYEPWAYGFNQPTLDQTTDPTSSAEAARVNGNAYTQFLRDAAELLHQNKKEIGVHVHGQIFRHCDGPPNSTPLPRNVDWQWQTWIREFADYVEFRGASNLRPENIREVTDRIGLATREAGIPFVYQSTRPPAVMHFAGPHHALAAEMDWVRGRGDVTAYNLYEVANFSRVNDQDQWEGSPDMAALVQKHWG